MKWYADVDFYLRALRQNPRIAFTEEPLVVTVAGSPHQVSEQLRDNGVVRMREALLLFEKAFAQLQADPEMAVFWWRILHDLRIRNLKAMDKHLDRYTQVPPALRAYFRHLFAHPPRSEVEGLARFVPSLLRGLTLARRAGS